MNLTTSAQNDYNNIISNFNNFMLQFNENDNVYLYNKWVGPPPLISPPFSDYQPLIQNWISSFSPGPSFSALQSGSTNGVDNIVYANRNNDPDPNVKTLFDFLMAIAGVLASRQSYNPPEQPIQEPGYTSSLVSIPNSSISPESYKPPPPFIPGTRKNSKYTDCAKELYASESAYYECEEFNKLNAPGPQKKQGTPNECFPTYGKSSPPVCAPDTTGTCTNGLMNVTGFPPCCNDNVPDSCIISPSNPYAPITPSGSVPVPPPLVNSSIYTPTPTPSENLSRAAANCVAKNPNYPAEMGSCVYNAENPCPTHYETTDTRFGTKMCCAPQSNNNANCFSTKSTFGSSGTDNTYILILLLIAILLFIFMKKK